jgi:hypothetical protein
MLCLGVGVLREALAADAAEAGRYQGDGHLGVVNHDLEDLDVLASAHVGRSAMMAS